MTNSMNKTILDIIDLIEDDHFPARRNITDYVIILLNNLEVKHELVQEIDKIIEKEYSKRDKKTLIKN